jgi:zinc-ribbon domain
MPSIIIECPSCNWEGKVAESLVGRKVKCGKCGNSFLVEVGGTYDLEPQAAPPAPEEPDPLPEMPRKGSKGPTKTKPAAAGPDPKLEKLMDQWAEE